MSGFAYKDGRLHAEAVDLSDIAAAAGTPTYVYSASVIEANYRAYADAMDGLNVGIHFALKANGNLAVVALLAGLGAGADIVSGGELKRALAAGVPAERIVFSGVGKSREELSQAVVAGVGQINVESEPELEALNDVAASLGRRQRAAFRINPDVDANTHEKISTGKKGDKFGIAYDRVRAIFATAARLPYIEPTGVALHIGSQLTDLEPFRRAYARAAELVRALRADGVRIDSIDLGGGIGITYENEVPPSLTDYAAMVAETVGNLGCKLAVEPGRSVVGPAGVLLTRVIYRKNGDDRAILILDAGMNDLVRPSMYGAYHPILPVVEPAAGAPVSPIDVAGPVCETGDTFARGRALSPIEAGDLVAIGAAGAYGFTMASNYNARPMPAEILVRGRHFEIIRPRQAVEALFADERIPGWVRR
ncbi:MAG TPA: diaminopimelate decarboxylase [Alphaproteobacteria bacterium]|nr:diaminopimelate decarboxylase [Alphaproteobacteria bacterium]